MSTFLQKLLIFTLFCYIALAPVLWLPSISVSGIKLLKVLLIITAITVFFFLSIINKTRIDLPVYLFALCVASTLLFPIFLLNSSSYFSEALSYTFNFIFGFVTLIIGFNLYKSIADNNTLFRNLYIALVLIVAFPISNFFFEYPDWSDQLPEVRDFGIKALWYTGFSAARTGWSETLALFVTLPFLFLGGEKKRSILLYLIVVSPIVVAQVLSTSRTGFLCSFLAIIAFMFKKSSKIELTSFFVAVTGLIIIFYSEILIVLRISSGSEEISDISDISSGRSDMYLNFFNMASKKPLEGLGFQGSWTELRKLGIDYEMHNSLLRVWIDHGFIFGIVITLLSIETIRIAIKTVFKKGESDFSFMLSVIILQGLFVAMFSPAFIFGGFQVSSLWWLSAGLLAKKHFVEDNITVRNG